MRAAESKQFTCPEKIIDDVFVYIQLGISFRLCEAELH